MLKLTILFLLTTIALNVKIASCFYCESHEPSELCSRIIQMRMEEDKYYAEVRNNESIKDKLMEELKKAMEESLTSQIILNKMEAELKDCKSKPDSSMFIGISVFIITIILLIALIVFVIQRTCGRWVNNGPQTTTRPMEMDESRLPEQPCVTDESRVPPSYQVALQMPIKAPETIYEDLPNEETPPPAYERIRY